MSSLLTLRGRWHSGCYAGALTLAAMVFVLGGLSPPAARDFVAPVSDYARQSVTMPH